MKIHTVRTGSQLFSGTSKTPCFWIVFYELYFLFQGQHTEDPHGEEGGQRNLLLRG